MSEWHHFRVQLEGLGVDPYAPDEVPADHPHFAEVQRIVAEYRGIPLPLFPQPRDWEGSPPRFTITSLDDVARWLCDEWSIVVAIKMGSEDGIFEAKKRAMQAIRNAHHILDVLKIEDRPLRQPPAENLEECKKQIQQLEQWFREKHASGWKAKVTPQGRKRVDEDQLNTNVARILKRDKKTPIRGIADQLGLSVGKIQGCDAWKKNQASLKADRAFGKKAERQLTDKQWAVIGEASPPSGSMEDNEIWEWLLNNTKNAENRDQYESLLNRTQEERNTLISLVRSQYRND